MDDEEIYVGDNSFWGGGDWEARLGWGNGKTTVGRVGRLIQMIGMARVNVFPAYRMDNILTGALQTTYDTMLELFPDQRPVVVTRAAIPGMQAYAHGKFDALMAISRILKIWIYQAHGLAIIPQHGTHFVGELR